MNVGSKRMGEHADKVQQASTQAETGAKKTGQSERGLSNAAQGSIEADGQELLQQKESEAEASDTLFLTMGRKSRRSSVVSVIHVLCY